MTIPKPVGFDKSGRTCWELNNSLEEEWLGVVDVIKNLKVSMALIAPERLSALWKQLPEDERCASKDTLLEKLRRLLATLMEPWQRYTTEDGGLNGILVPFQNWV